MQPVKFAEQNSTYTAPGCGPLPAWRGEDAYGQYRIISCWRLTWRERLKTLVTGRVWLDIRGYQQPPVAILVDKPFVDHRGTEGTEK